jgi:TPR repeat protein
MNMARPAAFWLALAVLAVPLAGRAQQAPPAGKEAAPEEKLPAEEAFNRGEKAYEQQNYADAMRWYRAAADQGYAHAQVHVGNLYTDGEGVEQNYAEALGWFRKAAEQGDYEAQNNIGFFYLSGWGVPQDYGQAMEWFRKAADKGNEVAQRNVAMMYLQGLGVPADKDEAIRWFKKSAEAGDEDSKDALKELGAE